MSQFLDSTWASSWSVPSSEANLSWGALSQSQGWSTSWNQAPSAESHMFHKRQVAQTNHTTNLGAASSVFGTEAINPPSGFSNVSYDLPASTFYELLPGQTWDSQVPVVPPSKPISHAPSNSTALSTPASPMKHIPQSNQTHNRNHSSTGWVEVNSAEAWVPSTASMPTSPTKSANTRVPIAKPQASSPPQNVSPQPGIQNLNNSNLKRHHDIEDELGHQDRYKTELCRSWHENGTCRYGSKCQFAHGPNELRPVMRHPKYKTELCRSWVETGSCPYGRRCRFIHQDNPTDAAIRVQQQARIQQQQQVQQQQVQQQQVQQQQQQLQSSEPVVPRQTLYYQTSLFNGSPPYAPLGYGAHLLPNGSPPLSPSTRSALWINDTFQDEDEDEDFGTLTLTPLIGQLNLSAEPVPMANTRPATNPTPIGPVGSPLNRNNDKATDPETADSGNEKKKKKSGRLGIFQKLSSTKSK